MQVTDRRRAMTLLAELTRELLDRGNDPQATREACDGIEEIVISLQMMRKDPEVAAIVAAERAKGGSRGQTE